MSGDSEQRLKSDPAIYLREQPSPTSPCHLLVEQLGSHDGAPVPMHMVAKVAVRLHRLSMWSERFEGWWRTGKKLVAVVGASAMASLGGAYTSCQHAHDARVADDVRAEAAERAFQEYRHNMDDKIDQLRRGVDDRTDQLRQDIREIRTLFRKFTGIDPGGGITVVKTP